MNATSDGLHAAGAVPLPTVLVVDDEVRSLDAIRRTLDEEFRVVTACDAQVARRVLEQEEVAVILCDQRMPGTTGVAFLTEARERWPDAVRIVISGYTDSEDIIAGINQAGIYQYILKPWMPDHLIQSVRGAAEARQLQHGLIRLDLDLRSGPGNLRAKRRSRLAQARRVFDFDRMVRAVGSPLDDLCDMAWRFARHDMSVLISGESGTGKELMARAIHYASPRLTGPFVVENCAAIPDSLLESELFGHKRGAFTGAVDDHVGLFQRATGGTVFLDEIGETSPAFQVKLLRVLQEGEVRPVGSTRPIAVDVRVVAATHRDLEADVRDGRFREDLYYRIAGVTLAIPPLRERAGDIVPIAESLLANVALEIGVPVPEFDEDCRAILLGYPWPGNIRELRNELARALALADGGPMHASLFSRKLLNGRSGRSTTVGRSGELAIPTGGTLADRLDAVEAMLLRETLLRHRWNRTHAAQELGLSRVGLRAKMQRFGLADNRRGGDAGSGAGAGASADQRKHES